MKKNSFFIQYLFLLAFIMTSCGSEGPVDTPDNINQDEIVSDWPLSTNLDLSQEEAILLDGINQFSDSLIREAGKLSYDGEFCISPVSVTMYLGMLANSTDSEMRDRILSALSVDDLTVLNSLCEKIMHYIPCDDNGSCISLNNCFWVSDSYTVPENFVMTMAEVFNAEVRSVDFTDRETVPSINRWVCEKTNGLIDTLLDGDWKNYVSTVMTNANTVYFKGNWASKFPEEATNMDIFHTPQGDKKVEMMHQTVLTSYASNDKVQLVNMEFERPMNDMELYLPNEGVEIKELLRILIPSMQDELRKSYEGCHVALSLPKFKKNSDIDIKRLLDCFGVSPLEEVDFSSIGLGIQPVSTLHKTSFKMDENGAEMAAVTGGWFGSADPDDSEYRNIEVDFNRPFLYVIRNKKTGIILMVGIVADPQ